MIIDRWIKTAGFRTIQIYIYIYIYTHTYNIQIYIYTPQQNLFASNELLEIYRQGKHKTDCIFQTTDYRLQISELEKKPQSADQMKQISDLMKQIINCRLKSQKTDCRQVNQKTNAGLIKQIINCSLKSQKTEQGNKFEVQ